MSATKRPARVALVTECSMSDNVAVQLSRRRIRAALQSLPAHEAHHAAKIRRALETMKDEVTIDPAIAAPARRAVERMLAL